MRSYWQCLVEPEQCHLFKCLGHIRRSSKLAGILYKQLSDNNLPHFKTMCGKKHDMRKRYNFCSLHGRHLILCLVEPEQCHLFNAWAISDVVANLQAFCINS